jgi:hypothetical protein
MPTKRRTRSRRSRGGSGMQTPLAFSDFNSTSSGLGASGHGVSQFGDVGGGEVPGTSQYTMKGGHGGGSTCGSGNGGAVPIVGGVVPGASGGPQYPLGATMKGGKRGSRGGNFIAQAAVPAALFYASNAASRYGIAGSFGLGRRFNRSTQGYRRSGRRSKRSGSRRYRRR